MAQKLPNPLPTEPRPPPPPPPPNVANETLYGLNISFEIPGLPVGKGRPRFARRGNFVSTYTDSKTASYENLVKIKAQEVMAGRVAIAGPVQVSVGIWVTPPASWSQKKQRMALDNKILPTSKPDIDNVIKGIFDAMNDIVWRDDKQVVNVSAYKLYSCIAQTTVSVKEIIF